MQTRSLFYRARLKQIQYPVFLLTSNDALKGLEYDDLRINYLKRALYSAAAYELEGIVCPSACLFQHSWFIPLVRRLKLKVITYGEANNSVFSIQEVKRTGAVTGIIYDRIFDFIQCTKDHWVPKPPPRPCEPTDLGFIIGYTGFVPGRQDLVGTESQKSGKSRCPPRTIEPTYPPVVLDDMDPTISRNRPIKS
ncbi:hypothetical protein RvY_00600 [Ramazzottius varieornatus]|uniref:GP-PDE domain-containing protein n=1 Tax=Ramazzottius varieornatus TaxID=947166 RepID=A0A1D1UJL6_RAMVA|nr:hypothetical protein RvY_00600 [Ramazzottius varieornatus]